MTNACLFAAIKLLARREYSCLALRRKLIEKKFSEEEIESAVQVCVEKKYVDDERFTAAYIRTKLRAKPVGPLYLLQYLHAQGISDEVFWRVWKGLEIDEGELVESAKKRYSKKYTDPLKLQQFLYSKGLKF